ncbi:cobalt-precorrin-5B (C(1))-methyltransferase CbiD [Thermosulfuriphilus sp.]
MKKRLRTGYTTGACAAAAAKAAALLLLRGKRTLEVEIPFPDGSRHRFSIKRLWQEGETAWASVIKDAGDDPDVTNRAEIQAGVSLTKKEGLEFIGGKGVGLVTKPGLPVPPGQPAINPGPRRMIREALLEVTGPNLGLRVTISVPEGEKLAPKTLNARLGILGGISILGTTGIVKPVSAEAWCATIATAMNVAEAVGIREIVLATGRTSEKAVGRILHLPEEAFIHMGDYLAFSLKEAARHPFRIIHLATQWAKLVKAALGFSQTHVRHGIAGPREVERLLAELLPQKRLLFPGANTARETFEIIRNRPDAQEIFHRVIQKTSQRLIPLLRQDQKLCYHLISYHQEVVCSRCLESM